LDVDPDAVISFELPRQLDEARFVSGDHHEVVAVGGDERRQFAAESLGGARENRCPARLVQSFSHRIRAPECRLAMTVR
jgi:hypothetical protein